MKANEAPEKIYLQENTITYCNGEWLPAEWSETMVKDTDIEYTRTDAFIEKTVEWLKKSITNNPECNRIISKNGVITMGLLIEDFKNYMKGE